MLVKLKDLAPLLLKKERVNGDIDPMVLTDLLRGGKTSNDRRKELVKDGDYSDEEQTILLNALGEQVPFDLHRNMFIPTLKLKTELGHSSNVQGIDTIATYDKTIHEFIIDSPTLTSRKWWPGGLGKTATHAIAIARLLLDGKDVGVQSFIVQIRSLDDHKPMFGIKVRDIGPKIGFNAVDNVDCSFHNVRIPRENMLMRYAKVLPDGTFIKPTSDKLVYLIMVQVRTNLIKTLGERLAPTTTITARCSAARIQGPKPNQKGEFQVLDYQNQQHALFPLIAIAYASQFAGSTVANMHDSALKSIKNGALGSLPSWQSCTLYLPD